MEKAHLFRLLSSRLFAAAVALCAPAVLAQAAPPAASHPFAQSKPVPGQYIVVFKNRVSNPAAETANIMRGLGGQVRHVYSSAIKGFAASLPDAALQGLLNNPNVDYIEQDQTVALNQVSPQYQATWGLDRIDQRAGQDSWYNFNYTGAGVHAFIIDTGILATHSEFSGRVQPGYNTVDTDVTNTNDCNGHGTHVAGTVGGTTWGVAKGVSLIPVRVLNCSGSGTWSGVIAGIDWVANNTLRPAAANMSLGGGKSTAVNAAVAGAVNAGVTMAVAAGNDNKNACNYSPASEPSAITVGATTSGDARASYSNYGTCVDIFGPGSSITSAWNTSATATNTISGTSMATPHVTGVAVLALEAAKKSTSTTASTSPAAIASFLVANATVNRISSVGTGSPNLLLYSLADGAPTEPAMQTVGVTSLTGYGVKIVGSNWRAYATVTIKNATSAVVPNATVSGSFSTGGTASCVTNSDGICTMSSAKISAGSTKVTVTNVSGTNMAYDSNPGPHEITILKP